MASALNDALVAIRFAENLFSIGVGAQQLDEASRDNEKMLNIAQLLIGLKPVTTPSVTGIKQLFDSNPRVRNALTRSGLKDVREITLLRISDLQDMRGFGEKITSTIRTSLQTWGLDILGDDESRIDKADLLYPEGDAPEWVTRLGEESIWKLSNLGHIHFN